MKDLILEIAQTCGEATGDDILDEMFLKYNEASPRDDSPVYYRFLYDLAKRTKDRKLTMIELGCKYGAASLHFLKGGGNSSIGVDVANQIDLRLFENLNFTFKEGWSTDKNISTEIGMADILFIDTDHTYNTTSQEFALWEPKIKDGGIILFDDIMATEYGCSKFWQELKGDKIEFAHLHPVGWGFGVYFK